MTKRAERMKRFLSAHGWETGNRYERGPCKKCGLYVLNHEDKFCSSCGTKLPIAKISSNSSDELEEAIAYALGEKRSMK